MSDIIEYTEGTIIYTNDPDAIEINKEHDLFMNVMYDAGQTGMPHAIRCGELLIAKKAKLPHGSFIDWMECNCNFGRTQSQKYMYIATNVHSNGHLDKETSIDRAIALINASKPKKRKKAVPFEWSQQMLVKAAMIGMEAIKKLMVKLTYDTQDNDGAEYYKQMIYKFCEEILKKR